MARMLKLGDVFELVIDRLNDGTLTQQDDVLVVQEPSLHVVASIGEQVQVLVVEESSDEFLADMAFVTDPFAEVPFG